MSVHLQIHSNPYDIFHVNKYKKIKGSLKYSQVEHWEITWGSIKRINFLKETVGKLASVYTNVWAPNDVTISLLVNPI